MSPMGAELPVRLDPKNIYGGWVGIYGKLYTPG